MTGYVSAFWWRYLPSAVGRLSRGAHATVQDGHYLTGVPMLAGFLSTAVLLAGFVASYLRPNRLYAEIYTESPLLVGALLCIGFVGAHYGAVGWLGFVIGDLLVASPRAGVAQADFRFASVVAYVALLLAIVGFPVGIRRLLDAFRVLDAAPAFIVLPIATTAMGLSAYYAVSTWINSQQLIARMFFFYQGFASATDASTVPLQENATSLARAVAVAAGGRTLLAALMTIDEDARERVEHTEDILREQASRGGLLDGLPQIIKIVAATILAVLLLGGVIQSWSNGLVMFGILLLFQMIRTRLLPLPISGPQRFVMKIPTVFRVVGLLLIAQQITSNVNIDSYSSLMWVTVAMLALSTLLLPAPEPEETSGRDDDEAETLDEAAIAWFDGDYREGVAPDGSAR